MGLVSGKGMKTPCKVSGGQLNWEVGVVELVKCDPAPIRAIGIPLPFDWCRQDRRKVSSSDPDGYGASVLRAMYHLVHRN
jgi:hypothetical protein